MLQWEFLFCNFLLLDIVTISDQKGHLLKKKKYNPERLLFSVNVVPISRISVQITKI